MLGDEQMYANKQTRGDILPKIQHRICVKWWYTIHWIVPTVNSIKIWYSNNSGILWPYQWMVIFHHKSNKFMWPCYLCFFCPMKINIPVFLHYSKYKRWFSYLRNYFEIRVLDNFSFKIILLNQVSGSVGIFSDLKHDIINSHGGYFHYLKWGPYILLTGM